MAPVMVEIIDSKGYVVPDANNAVTFTVTGPGKKPTERLRSRV